MTDLILDTTRVLVVDDDAAVRGLIRRALTPEDLDVIDATTGAEALERFRADGADLIILDIGLPGSSGLDVLMEVRRTSQVPVVLLTGRSQEADRIAGLDLGADDYVVKPFYPGELAARVRAHLRRVRPEAETRLTLGGVVIDRQSREVLVDDQPVELTAKEFDLLAFLAGSPRQVFTRDQLLRSVWESSSEWQDPATVTEHVRRVRNKLDGTSATLAIATVRGVGYRLEPGG